MPTDLIIGFLTLLALEIVLGIDNVVFISILANKLPEHQRARARNIGLGLALGTRVLLLLGISWVVGLTATIFSLPFELPHDAHEISGRDLILLGGGLFLLGKATFEIHESLEGEEGHAGKKVAASFGAVIVQILLLDIVFSLDSVITAVGMVDEIWVMIAAVIIAVIVMLISAGPLSRFVHEHPTVKMLALSFLLLIGLMLVAESFDVHVPKGYIYFAMGFSVVVELLNLWMRRKREPVQLKQRYSEENAEVLTHLANVAARGASGGTAPAAGTDAPSSGASPAEGTGDDGTARPDPDKPTG
ncbi:TerC family protein [Allonocardiopsis opalescens]|uniref:Putative tellurium resistance membrane protein TerC n=1 Tax=Allonocardiopsis opalescens TaxID=1144618 RepID=A0A2T0PUI6_9ACTN|nr:TerC family protein [Allonocardiopsis opalescens]PRX92468.1 putative tellurium resistance membrane protein TerC [Allonocardiopsis opalescens]